MASDQPTVTTRVKAIGNFLASTGKNQKLAKQIESYLLLLPALLILALFFFWPALYNFLLSFQRISLFDLAKGGTWIGLSNFVELAGDPLAALALKNTVLWLTMATVVLRLGLGLGLALLLDASVLRRWRLSGLARSMMLIPWVTPPVVAIAAWKWLLHPRYGAINQILVETGLIHDGIPFLVKTSTVWWAIVAIVVWRELPFVAISLLAGLQSIPGELYDAARVDGASEIRLFWHITLPLLRPVLVVVTLLTVIWTYNNFVYVWLTTQGGPGNFTHVLATEMYTEAFTNYRMGYGAAVGVLMSAIMLIFSIIYFQTIFKKSVGQGKI
jgi:multiple sugar transport system permease protein